MGTGGAKPFWSSSPKLSGWEDILRKAAKMKMLEVGKYSSNPRPMVSLVVQVCQVFSSIPSYNQPIWVSSKAQIL